MQEGQLKTAKIKKLMPVTLAIAIFMQMLDSTILNTSLPAIAKDLHESPLNMQNAIVSYVLTLALFMPVSGYLADKFGTQKVFIFALIVFALGSLFCSLSQNLTELVIARVVEGVGGSLMTPVGKLALLKTFDKKEMIAAMNYAIIPALIGPVLGPLVGGYFVDYFSWHWIFLINIPIAIFGVLLSLRYMPDYRSPIINFGLKGFFIFAGASLILSIAVEWLGNAKNITPVLFIFSLGFLLLYYYFQYAKKDDNPIFPVSLFKVRTFRVGILGNLATRLGISSVPLLLPLMIQVAYGQSAVTSGWIVAPMAITAMFGKSVVIKLLRKLGFRRTLIANTFFIGILICCMAIPDIHTSIYWYIPIISLLGFFNTIQFTSMNSISIADLDPTNTSSANSFLAVNQQLAMGFGISFGLVVLKIFENSGIVSGQIVPAFRYTFLVMGIITLFSSLVFRRLQPGDGENIQAE